VGPQDRRGDGGRGRSATQLQVKGKNVSVTDELFEHAERKLAKLARHLPPWDEATRVELELSMERNPSIERRQVAELTVWTQGPVLRVRESAPDFIQAIDLAAHKLQRQMVRYRERRRSQRRPPSPEPPEPAQMEDEGEDGRPDRPRIVKTKRFEMKPMTPEDAILNLEMLQHSFYVFANADSGAVNVVYRRGDGDYGLIEPER
jgi:putative sigma-54 modulation protein